MTTIRGVDPGDLSSAGWAVLFSPDIGPEVREALQPLLELRREQATQRRCNYYCEFNYQPGQTKAVFLSERGVGFGPANPDRLPYYLLIVGDPRTIPFRFQYELDVQYAVGRIHFDRPEDYARYAEGILAAEKGNIRRSRELAFFCVSHDNITAAARERLVEPLIETTLSGRNDWTKRLAIGEAASKAELSSILNGGSAPAILFSSSHGLKYELDDKRQLCNQGAILCQDWPGPHRLGTPIDPDFYFRADDLSPDSDLNGLIALMFACYSAGTPSFDNFSISAMSKPSRIAPYPFVSNLAKRLLSQGALGLVGHVDRAWDFSFNTFINDGTDIEYFDSLLKTLIDGDTIGAAMEYVNHRYAQLAVLLSGLLIDQYESRRPPASHVAQMKRASIDARNYILIGDPAVRLSSES